MTWQPNFAAFFRLQASNLQLFRLAQEGDDFSEDHLVISSGIDLFSESLYVRKWLIYSSELNGSIKVFPQYQSIISQKIPAVSWFSKKVFHCFPNVFTFTFQEVFHETSAEVSPGADVSSSCGRRNLEGDGPIPSGWIWCKLTAIVSNPKRTRTLHPNPMFNSEI